MPSPLIHSLATIFALGCLSSAQEPVPEEDASSFGGRVAQSAYWSEDAEPAWSHGTSTSLHWTPGSNDLGLDELRVGLDLIGSGFQFDSLWALEPGAGLSWSRGMASLDLDAWASLSGGDTLADQGASADLAFDLARSDRDILSFVLSGSLSEASGSEAGAGIRWLRSSGRYRFDAGFAATRRWGVDVSALAQNMPRRLAARSEEGDQWVLGGDGGVRILLGSFALSTRLSASATRSELEASRSGGQGRRRTTSGTSTETLALWSLDATPSVRASWNRGVFDVAGTLGSTSSYALSAQGETEPFQPWVSLSAGVGW